MTDFNNNKTESAFKSGFVAILGKPNAGKSTLLNNLVGQKIAIVSPKPQTTRDSFLGIKTTDDYQVVFSDTPGIMEPKNLLNQALIDSASMAVEDVDLIYHILDVTDPDPVSPAVSEILKSVDIPAFLIVNKIDRIGGKFCYEDHQNLPPREDYKQVIPVSALNGTNIDLLLKETLNLLPEGPLYFDPEQVSDRNLRFLSSEIVREKAFELLGQELPYSVAVQVEEFKEREKGKTYIRAVIYVERESQKGMVIGSGGGKLKKIGRLARPEIEELVGSPVYLELWVKVRKKWTKHENDLRQFGYYPKKQ